MYVLYHFKKIFLDEACRHYKKHYHEKRPIKKVAIIRHVMFRKVKPRHVLMNPLSNYSDAIK